MNLNFSVIIDFLQEFNQRYAITGLFQEREPGYLLTQQELIIILAILVIGLLWCFAGHLMVRVWAALMGLGLGFLFGAMVASLFTSEVVIILISGAVLGLAFGVLAGLIFPLGTFLVTLLAVFGVMIVILNAQSLTMLIIALVVGLIVAVLTFKFPIPIVIIVTAVCGAFVSAETLQLLVNYNLLIFVVMVVALAVGGMCTQFLFENGKRKRQHLDRANEIKRSKSVDNEIEKARNLVDILDEPVEESPKDKKKPKEEKVKKEKVKKEKKGNKGKNEPVIVFDGDINGDEEGIGDVEIGQKEKEIAESSSLLGSDKIDEKEFQLNIAGRDKVSPMNVASDKVNEPPKGVTPDKEEPPKSVAPDIEKELPKSVAPDMEKELPKRVAPDIEKELPKSVAPSLEKELPKNVAPDIEKELPKSVAPDIDKEFPKSVTPDIEKELPKSVAPSLERELPKSVAPDGEIEPPKNVASMVAEEELDQAVRDRLDRIVDEIVERKLRDRVNAMESQRLEEKPVIAGEQPKEKPVEAEEKPKEKLRETEEQPPLARLEKYLEQRSGGASEELKSDSQVKSEDKQKETNRVAAISNNQTDEEVEREAARIDKAKRDWINQLASDKTPKNDD
jgi:hypothetical protein